MPSREAQVSSGVLLGPEEGEYPSVLEIIAPAGFEAHSAEPAQLVPADGMPDMEALARLWTKYGLDMDIGSVAELTQRHGVAFGPASP